MTPDTISISIEAQGAETRQLVASLIHDKLFSSGFSNIDVGIASRDDLTSKLMESDRLPSLLDEMREANPSLFERPVAILAIPYSSNPVEESEPRMTLLKDRQDQVELNPSQGQLEDDTVVDPVAYAIEHITLSP
jgi:hypothetical protein